MRRWVPTLAALLICACARHEAAPPAASSATATAPDAGDAEAPLPPAVLGAGELFRLERWADAARAIDALPEAERARPVVRFARARAGLGAGDAKAALAALEGIDAALPELAERIARTRALAWLEVGPFDRAGDWFAARDQAADWLRAARAYDRAGDAAKMRAQCTRILGAAGRTRADEAAARALRLPGERGADAAADAAWLEAEAPDLADSAAATASAERRPLRGDELALRAKRLADAGRAADARAALDEGARAKTGALSGAALDRARADVEWRSRSWAEAAVAYGKLAGAGGAKAAEDAFFAARSLSRADRDDDAIAAYRALQARHAKTRWATQARYQIARLDLLHARWADAARGLEDALAARDLGADRGEAERLLPVARLLAGDAARARKDLEDRARREGDRGASRTARELGGLAALRGGDRAAATSAWTELAEKAPLTWQGLLARARLAEAGAPVPALGVAPVASAPLTPPVPALVTTLVALGLEDDAAAILARHESELRRAFPGRETEALCAAYATVGAGRRRFQLGQSLTIDGVPDGGHAWAWSCAYPTPFSGPVREAEAREKLPPGLVHAVMRQESAFDPRAVSPARAVGLLQLMPETARTVAGELGVAHADADLVRPAHNVSLGAHFLASLLGKLDGRTPLAVAAYNAGPDAIERWRGRLSAADVDVFVELIPYVETRHYVGLVMTSLARYAYLSGGEAALPKIELRLR